MKIFDRILNVMCFLSKLIIAFVLFSVALDFICRYAFNSPLIWVIPLSQYSLVYITFLGAPWLLREEGHVMMEIVVEKLGDAGRAWFGIGSSVLGIIVSFIFVWYGALTTYDHFVHGIYESAVMEMPIAPVLAIIPIGSFFLLAQFVRRGMKYAGMLKLGGREEVKALESDDDATSTGL
jgi:TRAP-type C4-dicarboxylate transport system permease small subunit